MGHKTWRVCEGGTEGGHSDDWMISWPRCIEEEKLSCCIGVYLCSPYKYTFEVVQKEVVGCPLSKRLLLYHVKRTKGIKKEGGSRPHTK